MAAEANESKTVLNMSPTSRNEVWTSSINRGKTVVCVFDCERAFKAV